MAQQEHQLPSQTLTHTEGQLTSSPTSVETEPLAEDILDRGATRVSSPSKDAIRRFRRNWAAMISLVVVAALVFIAVFAPFMHTTNPLSQDYFTLWSGPSGSHWFGTDGVGRDIYSRLVFGLRVPLMVGLIGTMITVVIGALIGVTAGFFGGVTDGVLSRFTDVIFAFPAFLLSLITVALFGQALDPIFGGAGRVMLLTFIFALVSWPPLTRFVRSLSLALTQQQFVEAAKTSGSSNWKIIRRHLLPNMWGLILVQAALITVGIIYTEVTLSIFGLGIAPPDPDVGQMLWDGASNMGSQVAAGIYCEVIFPAVVLAVLLLALTFIGDGVRDAVDPRMNS